MICRETGSIIRVRILEFCSEAEGTCKPSNFGYSLSTTSKWQTMHLYDNIIKGGLRVAIPLKLTFAVIWSLNLTQYSTRYRTTRVASFEVHVQGLALSARLFDYDRDSDHFGRQIIPHTIVTVYVVDIDLDINCLVPSLRIFSYWMKITSGIGWHFKLKLWQDGGPPLIDWGV